MQSSTPAESGCTIGPGGTAARLPVPGRLGCLWRRWCERRRSRVALLALDGRALRDIGLSPEDARREALKPFWRE